VESTLQSCSKDEAALAPWGEFNPATLDALAQVGVMVRFFRMPVYFFSNWKWEDVVVSEIRRDDTSVYFAAVTTGQKMPSSAEEIRLPRQALSAVVAEMDACRKELDDIAAAIRTLAKSLPVVESFRRNESDRLQLMTAQLDLERLADGRLLALSGWFPADREAAIRRFLDGFTAVVDIRNPAPGEDVPVQLQNSPFNRMFEPITRLYSLPAYRELDPTPFFAPAFAFFSGLCLGDVAYGMILLALAFLLYKKGPVSARPLFALAMILGGMTIFSGILLNGFFGLPIFGGEGIKDAIFPTGAAIFAPLAAYEGDKGTVYPAMSFALVVGFSQMLFAMVLQIVNRIRRGEAGTAILPFSWMMMFVGVVIWAAHANWYDLRVHELTVSRLQLGQMLLEIPQVVGQAVCLSGIGLMFVAGMVHGNASVLLRPLVFIWDFYNFATGNIGYMISYIRLFALGLTGGLLAMTFNNLALGFITSDAGVVNWASPMVVFTILLLVVGHALNFALAFVGAFVHPLRLTFVEFYQTLQFSGGGSEYRPLRRHE
jgi:V/A-type H+-transporting ATPase subunit I